MNLKLSLLFILSLLLFSCSAKTKSDSENNDVSNSSVNTYDGEVDNEDISNENIDETNIETNTLSSGCGLADGTYSATVGYNNPETGYSATYTLDVDVEDCQVIQINFPNDGYLDQDHISAADIDEDGNANVDGEDGKTYEIQIDN
ncbi:hypothetical protein [Flavobacterium gawalongense]|uniref:Lipoprotein n=1 Tax=Flavobacterium gawalongense TaxID=2594432 RepID=A0A553BDQ2_9FLAO|nr:hypothetical protein [Flavobacterium gawalongense]TRX06381.1 hypothetical protein FNW11_14510 [Flavobacterium gawalongense]TRX12750.1 hypothetical protein FNW10_04170 [Flavobacterium gawalongense]TRX30461.1 hypothetical protein FNW38_03575 [Flavobacterium gawalongense]